MVFEFTIDDDELSKDEKVDKSTLACEWYRVQLPPSASALSRQIAKAQAKRAEKEDRRRRRIDLSTVRETDESSRHPSTDESSIRQTEQTVPRKSRMESSLLDVQMTSPIEVARDEEPMDDEERDLLIMLLSGCEGVDSRGWHPSRKISAPDLGTSHIDMGGPPYPLLSNNPPLRMPPRLSDVPTSPGLPVAPLSAKVSEWLERAESPGAASSILSDMAAAEVVAAIGTIDDDEEGDEFYDAEENAPPQEVDNLTKGMSLCRIGNGNAMAQSLVRVEEETDVARQQNARSSSVSPRPAALHAEFNRNTPISATFNVKHSSTLPRPLPSSSTNGNPFRPADPSVVIGPPLLTSTPARPARSILRVHNVNRNIVPPRQVSMPSDPVHSASRTSPTPSSIVAPSRPPSVASNSSQQQRVPMPDSRSMVRPDLEKLHGLAQLQEEALRKMVMEKQQQQDMERKMSWHSDNDNKHSTSTHSSIGSLSSSKSVDGSQHKLSAVSNSRIPTPSRSRLPTPRASALPKRVSSVAAATSRPSQSQRTTPAPTSVDDCF